MTFGGLWALVEKEGGNKFALKSALAKGRERGEFYFDGGLYSTKPPAKKAPKKKTPASKRKQGPAATETAATTTA